ncbi:hypothetical protein HK097_000072 [Rhizophlyctis rosea]|uniref:uS12 prolyl 3,4-dihydroxylase n=1 Tax=Rhizophlyctis rosea TaxID=64517 RepID=A0AAD5XA67_9FUNG|nr:hypothetical protein HK097_000072 [Rhizophlyctis rosea]
MTSSPAEVSSAKTVTKDHPDGPARKRQRIAGKDLSVKEAFAPDLLAPETRSSLGKLFADSKPYLHCRIDRLIDDALLRKVRAEIAAALHFTVKETDIYKVFQTGDLANLDGLPASELAQLRSLFRLRNSLYSPDFRQFISDVTGCGSLSGSKTDMSINTYMNGCHLLNHDDVIGTRRVSYILYLTDPDEPWDPKNGGALELYPVVKKGIPDVAPTVVIPPQWNQFVMFTVQPGHSFHSVEEVVVDKARLSISGWFHIPQEGEPGYDEERDDGEAPSSLEQLQAEADDALPFVAYEEPVDDAVMGGLSEDDILSLKDYINPTYLNAKTLEQVSQRFLEDSSIQLVDFLSKEFVTTVQSATLSADKADNLTLHQMPPHGTGLRGQWKVQGPPHKHRYLVLDPSTTPSDPTLDPTSTHFQTLHTLFSSPSFRRFLTRLTHLHLLSHRGRARRFRPGLDYTLATTNSSRQVLDATLCLATTTSKHDSTLWASDEVGGYDCYMAPNDGEEDPAVYKQVEDEGALLTVSAGWNVLNLVVRDVGLLNFIKYVSAGAPGSRWDGMEEV